MGTIRVTTSWKNTGNLIIPKLTISVSLRNATTKSASQSYTNVKPGQSGSRTFEFTYVPGGYWYKITVTALDEVGNKLDEKSKDVYLPLYKGKHATIRILEVKKGYVRVSVKNDGDVDGYFWIGCSICSSDWSQCFDIKPVQEYLSRGREKELSFWFSHDAMIKVVTRTPRIAVVAVWEGYDPSRNVMIPPRYSYATASYPY